MRRPALLLVTILFAHSAPICRAQNSVGIKIKQVGLEGVYKEGADSRIQIGLRNSTGQPSTFSLLVSEISFNAGGNPITETFRIAVSLAASEQRNIDVPLPLSYDERAVIYVEARDSAGRSIARTARRMSKPTTQKIVAMICSNAELCGSIRKTILLSGSADEQTQKSSTVSLVQLLDPPAQDWAYSQASVVILAAPLSTLSTSQLEALQLYMLSGGQLLLVEDQLGDSNARRGRGLGSSTNLAPASARFLEAYRSRYAEGEAHSVVNGQFAHFASVPSQAFSDFLRPLGFSTSTPPDVRQRFLGKVLLEGEGSGLAHARWLEKRLGTSFRFPSFLEIVAWLVGYILLFGFVHFVLLRRMGRQEWGWITIPALAIVVSSLLYLSSERHRPRNFGVDEMTVYRMDDQSPLAPAVARIRVSSPWRAVVAPQLPASWTHFPRNRRNLSDMVAFTQAQDPWLPEIRIDSHWECTLPLRRWSFADLSFHGHQRFAGSVHRDSSGHLHNDTGVSFGQAIVVDADDVLVLGYLPPGADVDLGHVRRLSYESQAGRIAGRGPFGYPDPPFRVSPSKDQDRYSLNLEASESEWKALDTTPFSLTELLRGWSRMGDDVFSDTKAVFFGLTEQAPVGATLAGAAPDRKSASLVIVSFGKWP